MYILRCLYILLVECRLSSGRDFGHPVRNRMPTVGRIRCDAGRSGVLLWPRRTTTGALDFPIAVVRDRRVVAVMDSYP